jgi:hypothetical protein
VLDKTDNQTQTDIIQRRSIKIGYKPETKSCRVQTFKGTSKSVGVGKETIINDSSCQTVGSWTQSKCDIGIECKQAPGAKTRHCQTFWEREDKCVSFHPKLVSKGTNTVLHSDDNSAHVQDGDFSFDEKLTPVMVSTPKENKTVTKDKPSRSTGFCPVSGQEQTTVMLPKDSGLGNTLEPVSLEVVSSFQDGNKGEGGSKVDTEVKFSVTPPDMPIKLGEFIEKYCGNLSDRGIIEQGRTENTNVHCIVQKVDTNRPDTITYICILDSIVIMAYSTQLFGSILYYTGNCIRLCDETLKHFTISTASVNNSKMATDSAEYQKISQMVIKEVPRYIRKLELKQTLLVNV